MQLYFVRHGKAVATGEWSGAERDRPLTADGRDEMRAAARGLRKLSVAPDVILTSPFARARETADLIANALGTPPQVLDELAPGATLRGLESALAAQAGTAALLFTGHEPDLSAVIGELIGVGGPARVEMKKGACCRVDLAEPRSAGSSPVLEGQGTLAWLLTAKQLIRIGAK